MKRLIIFLVILFFISGCNKTQQSAYNNSNTIEDVTAKNIDSELSVENTNAKIANQNGSYKIIYNDNLNDIQTEAELLYENVYENEIIVLYIEPLNIKNVIYKNDMQDNIKIGIFRSNALSEEEYASDLILLNSDANILFAEPNYQVDIGELSEPAVNDEYYESLWGLNQINAEGAWDVTEGSKEVVVAVIDTGIDYNHEDLSSNIWKNSDEIAENGIDDDKNGLVDDVKGFDFYNWDTDPMDDHYHGTHCAGTIGAKSNNSAGIAGVSPNVSLMPIKVLSSNGSSNTLLIYFGFKYAVENGADIISASFGGYGFSYLSYIGVYYAYKNNVLVVAAAGNEANNNDSIKRAYPASYPFSNIISVASSNQNDDLSYFSNYGKTNVDIAAPGENIYSTVPSDGYSTLSGTSMATPHVSGVASLVLSMDMELTHISIKEYILNHAHKADTLKNYVKTGARLDANATINDKNLKKVLEVTSVTPDINSSNVSLDADIKATFNYEIDSNLLTSNTFFVKDHNNNKIDGNITYQNTTATFTPNELLQEGVTYTLTLIKTLQTSTNIKMKNDFTSQFTTRLTPVVQEHEEINSDIGSTMPANQQTNVDIYTKIEIILNYELSPSMIKDMVFSLIDSSGNSVSGLRSLSSNKMTFTPKSPLESAEKYTVHLDIESENMVYDFSFTTR